MALCVFARGKVIEVMSAVVIGEYPSVEKEVEGGVSTSHQDNTCSRH